MSKKIDLSLPSMSIADLFTTEEYRQDSRLERVQEISIGELKPFQNHPFKVNQDEEMKALCDSIREHGILSPLMARPLENGDYELVSGHRRKVAAEILGMDKLPVLVRNMSDDEAVILMVDSNIQRENLLPSEKAFAYKMKLDAMKHQGKSTSRQVGKKLWSVTMVSNEANESERQIQRYIRLTELVPPILELVDSKRIAFSPAVELSYLTKDEQAELWDIIQQEDATPSLSQAVRMKKMSQEVKLTPEDMFVIMTEEKPNQKEQVRIQTDKLRKFFPKSYTSQQMELEIVRLLEERQRKRNRDKER